MKIKSKILRLTTLALALTVIMPSAVDASARPMKKSELIRTGAYTTVYKRVYQNKAKLEFINIKTEKINTKPTSIEIKKANTKPVNIENKKVYTKPVNTKIGKVNTKPTISKTIKVINKLPAETGKLNPKPANTETGKLTGYPYSGYGVDVNMEGRTDREIELANLINAHRRSLGLNELKVSKSLTKVARFHVIDSHHYYSKGAPLAPNGQKGNMHSWSNGAPDIWNEVIYTSDHARAEGMWNKPKEITDYQGYGFEISAMGYGSPENYLKGWLNSPGHRVVVQSEGVWADMNFDCMGVSIGDNYAHVWFGSEIDPAGYY